MILTIARIAQDNDRARRQGFSTRKSFRTGREKSITSFLFFFSSSFLSMGHSSFFSIAVVGRCLSGSPFTDAYRYTLSHYYRNHSAVRRPKEHGLYFLSMYNQWCLLFPFSSLLSTVARIISPSASQFFLIPLALIQNLHKWFILIFI